jgi:hypothetical protein
MDSAITAAEKDVNQFQGGEGHAVYAEMKAAPPPNSIHSPYCLICGQETRLFSAEIAAAISHRTHRQIYRWIEDGSLHFIETPSGEALVCCRTLVERMDRKPH